MARLFSFASARVAIMVYITFITAAGAAAQDEATDYQAHQRSAFQAHGDQDYAGFLHHTLQALEIKPRSTAMRYNAACGYALTGAPEKALSMLRELAVFGIDYGAEQDPDLASVRALESYDAVRRLLREKLAPVHTSVEMFRIAQHDLAPEGIAYDPATGRTFVSSMRHGTIIVLDGLGNAFEFARIEHDVPMGCIGLELDPHRGLLWAAGATFNLVARATEADYWSTAIVGFDLATGAQVHSYPLRTPHGNTTFNDLAVSSTGDIYVTGNELYVLRNGETEPRLMELPEQFMATNGIAFTPGERHLLVGAGIDGIARLDLETGAWIWLEHPDELTLTGIDGMEYRDQALYAIQNGPQPWRLVRFDLNDDFSRVLGAEILELGNPDLVTATTCALAGDALYYVGHGRGPEESPVPVTPVQRQWLGETVVMRVPLTVDAQGQE